MKNFGSYLALGLSCAASWLGGPARAEISDNVVRVGVLNDISGIFQDTNGMGSVEAARMAAEDFNGGGKEHQGRDRLRRSPEQGRCRTGDRAQMARRRRGRCHRRRAEFGRRSRHQRAAARLPYDVPGVVHRQFRSHRQGLFAEYHPMGQRRLGDRQHDGGGDDGDAAARTGTSSRSNYALGKGIEAEATKYIEKHGGKVLGSSKHPLGTSDFASFLLQAQNSKSKVIGLANAGGDTINAVKQAPSSASSRVARRWWRSCCSSTTSTAWG